MTRAITPVLGAVLLALITVALAGILAASAGTAPLAGPDPGFTSVSATASGDGTVTLTHERGSALDVRDLSVRIAVDGTPLDTQPPVPFFSTPGFEPGPTGPFNSAADPEWTVGETASVTVAASNSPSIGAGDEVTVRLYRDGRPVAEATTTAISDGGG